MKVTNKFNLPQPFVDLVSYDDYNKGDSDYSTTGLLQSPRIAQLSKRHWGEMEEDAVDLVWRMSGQTKHVVLERIAKMNPERYMAEHRFFMTVNGFKVSGQVDLYDRETKTLYDWKETSIWKVMVGDNSDWTAQGNINLFLGVENGLEIDALCNIAFLKDWKKRESVTKQDYPLAQVRSCPLDIWPLNKTAGFIAERIQLHEAAKIELPLCSDKDRWAKPEKWAHMKKGRKSAVKLYDNEVQAQAAIDNGNQQEPTKHYLEHRPGENTRCLFYCGCSKFCSQFRNLMAEAA